MKDHVTDPFDEIVTRHDSMQRAGDCDVIGGVLLQAHTDRAWLIAEVDRLRGRLAMVRGLPCLACKGTKIAATFGRSVIRNRPCLFCADADGNSTGKRVPELESDK